MPTDPLTLFALLLVGHALADYPLQGDFVSKFKNPASGPLMGEAIWPTIMTAHAAIHGGFVGVITGSLTLGLVEFVAHWLIDWMKCKRRFGFNVDQGLHVACKLLWVSLIGVAP